MVQLNVPYTNTEPSHFYIASINSRRANVLEYASNCAIVLSLPLFFFHFFVSFLSHTQFNFKT